jgi:hypothetical protein
VSGRTIQSNHLLKFRGVVGTIEEADDLVRRIYEEDPSFEIEVFPIGEWRPIGDTDDLGDMTS